MHNNLSILDAALARCDVYGTRQGVNCEPPPVDEGYMDSLLDPQNSEVITTDTPNIRKVAETKSAENENVVDSSNSSNSSNSSGSKDPKPLEWGEPQPLIATFEAEDYPIDALPATLQAAVKEVQSFTQAPMSLVAASALTAISLAVQAHVDVNRAEKLAGPVGLFMLTIADSGERKTTCDGFFMNPVRDFELKQFEAGKPLLQDYRAKLDAWEAKRAGIKEKIRQQSKAGRSVNAEEGTLKTLERERPIAPRVPRLIYSDATPEALKWNLATQWPSGGIVSSEGALVFGAHGMGKDSIMRNLATLNQLWDGATIATERRTTESYLVRGARLTVGLQVQEATLRSFFDRSDGLARGTGFLARFLVSWPPSTQGTRLFVNPPENWPALATFNARLAEILALPVALDGDGALTPAGMALSLEAKKAWINYHDVVECGLKSGGELYDVRDVASKAADNAARLAALFQVFTGKPGDAVSSESFEAASRIVAWHLSESRRFFGELALPKELVNAARLDDWLIQRCKTNRTNTVATKEVQQFGPSGIRERAVIESCLRGLSELDRARVVMEGRRKLIYVNPALLQGAL